MKNISQVAEGLYSLTGHAQLFTYNVRRRSPNLRQIRVSSGMSSRPNIALVGLPSHHPMVPEAVRDKVKAQLSKVVEQMEAAG